MGDKSRIEWTDATWNPVTGCTKVSQGCKHCYAERSWARMAAPGQPYAGRAFTDIRCHPGRLDQPLRWRRPRRVFVNSMSDLFHEDVPDSFIDQVFEVIGACDDAGRGHVFQVLTKRPARMREYMQARGRDAWNSRRMNRSAWPARNVWLGVSVEDQATADERIPLLLDTPAAVRWISAEPLLARIDLYRGGWSLLRPLRPPPRDGFRPERIHWLVAGGESGPKARPMHPDWARRLRDQCLASGVPFFFKQWGQWAPSTHLHERGMIVGHQRHSFPWGRCNPQMASVGKRASGRLLDGRTWDEYPELAQ